MNIYHDENHAYFKRELLGKTVKIKLSEITEVNIDTANGYPLVCISFKGYVQHVPLEFNNIEEYHLLIAAIVSLLGCASAGPLKFNGEPYGEPSSRDYFILKILSKTSKTSGIVTFGAGVTNISGGGDCG